MWSERGELAIVFYFVNSDCKLVLNPHSVERVSNFIFSLYAYGEVAWRNLRPRVSTVRDLAMIHDGAMIHVSYPCHDSFPRTLHQVWTVYRPDKLFSNTIEYALQYAHTS